MNAILLQISAALVVITCLTHSIVGERRLIGPLMVMREGVLQHDLARQVIRFAWHLTTAIGLVVAFHLFSAGTDPSAGDRTIVLLSGAVLAGAGLFDAIYTRGKHIGWPLLFASGLFALLSSRA